MPSCTSDLVKAAITIHGPDGVSGWDEIYVADRDSVQAYAGVVDPT